MKLFKNIANDLPASIVVFFVALPLCLAIALASGASPLSGIISGVIGGVVTGLISGSQLGVSGPAAGLAGIVSSALVTLDGAFPVFLLAVVIAGLIQVIAGIAQSGIVAYYFPTSVITGMLSGIGLIIIGKEIPHAIGYDKDLISDDSFLQANGENTLSALEMAFHSVNMGALLITLISIAILILWDKVLSKKHKIFQLIQGPLVVVMLGVVIYSLFQSNVLPFSLSKDHIVQVPDLSSLDLIMGQLAFPDWSHLSDPRVYKLAIIIAVVASLETLLSVEATDKLSKAKRETPVNRELVAQGIGNMTAGLVGGLPITQVIVRSSVNISFGGKSKMSAILHGFWLILAVLFFTQFLNMIPFASLAAILLVIGYKLVNPKAFVKMFNAGWEQFIPFVVTVFAIFFTDMLIGIGLGLAVGILFTLRNVYLISHVVEIDQEVSVEGKKVHRIVLAEEVSFFNKAKIKQTLNEIPNDSHVLIDGTKSRVIHHDVIDVIQAFKVKAESKSITVDMVGVIAQRKNLEEKTEAFTKEMQQKITPEEALLRLKEGNKRFMKNLKVSRNLVQQASETSEGQNPFAVILSCIDSRTSAELIFDQGLGDIFSVRIAGNVLNNDILGSMEFGCKVAGAKLIVVLGHTNCGAVKGACDHVEMGNLTGLLTKIQPAIDGETTVTENRTSSNKEFLNKVTNLNVQLSVEAVKSKSEILKELIEQNQIMIVGGVHHIESGEVEFFHLK
jgi:carbonic anhydrase